MKKADFKNVIDTVYQSLCKLTATKGEEYANSDDDQFANFRRGAADLGIPKEAVLLIYLSKHMDSIKSYVKGLGKPVSHALSEPIEGRIDDAILYLVLLRGMVAKDVGWSKGFAAQDDLAIYKGTAREGGAGAGKIDTGIREKTRNDRVTDAVDRSVKGYAAEKPDDPVHYYWETDQPLVVWIKGQRVFDSRGKS